MTCPECGTPDAIDHAGDCGHCGSMAEFDPTPGHFAWEVF